MRVVIPGGSGQLGTLLAASLSRRGDDVVVLSRSPAPAGSWRVVQWDGKSVGAWAAELDGAGVVINLAGRSVNCRYGPKNREVILRSRVDSVRVVAEACARAAAPPPVWLQMSTATIYAHTFGPAHDERGVLGGFDANTPDTWRFSFDVASSWEQAFADADVPSTRKVVLRTAMVMARGEGGTFDLLLKLVRLGLGGAIAGGRQFMSWMHGDDFAAAVAFLIDRADLSGVFNLSAPHPIPQAEFMRGLRRAAGVPFGLPATAWMVEIGTRVMRTESELILKSRRVVPARLLAGGFQFRFPEWSPAAADLIRPTPPPTLPSV
jgi:uncharacterized protein (TIGR01777 family)